MSYQRTNYSDRENAVKQAPIQQKVAPAFMDQRRSTILQQQQQQLIQRKTCRFPIQCFSNGSGQAVIQRSDVTEYGVNDDESLTPDKKIKTRNSSEAWFRFPKDGDKIDTFKVNKTTSSPKGNSPVGAEIDLDDDAKLNQYEIGDLSRAQHFAGGDRLAKITASDRKAKWTWHHKQAPYYMELVDMAVHRSFYHHGGFSKWKEGTDDDNDE